MRGWMGDSRGVIRVSRVRARQGWSKSFEGLERECRVKRLEQKNAGLKSATLISVSNPVSQVLW